MMSAPASASATAIDLPMPLLQPVTNAVLPANENFERMLIIILVN
jgi:hypothetical protein